MDRCGFMIYHLNVGRIGPCEMKRIIDKGYCNGYTIGLHEMGQVVFQCRMAQETEKMLQSIENHTGNTAGNEEKETLC